MGGLGAALGLPTVGVRQFDFVNVIKVCSRVCKSGPCAVKVHLLAMLRRYMLVRLTVQVPYPNFSPCHPDLLCLT